MSIGSGPGGMPRLEDVAPTRKHLVVIGVALLTAALYAVTIGLRLSGVSRTGAILQGIVAIGLATSVFGHMLGGLDTIWREWKHKNWIGIDEAIFLTKDGWKSGLQSSRLRKNTGNEWTLFLPFGGWFNRPAVYLDGAPQPYRITEIFRESYPVSCYRVTASDAAGNRLKLHPTELLSLLQVRQGSSWSFAQLVCHSLSDGGELRTGKKQLSEMLDLRGKVMTDQMAVLRDSLKVIGNAVDRLSKTRRAQFQTKQTNSTEAKPIRQWLQEQHAELTRRMSEAIGMK